MKKNIENIDSIEQDQDLPYSVEISNERQFPEVQLKTETSIRLGSKGTLIIDDKEVEGYDTINYSRTQHNYPILSLTGVKKSDQENRSWPFRSVSVDVNNPNEELLNVNTLGVDFLKDENKSKRDKRGQQINSEDPIIVNDKEWSSLRNRKINPVSWEIDPIGNKIITYGRDDSGLNRENNISSVFVNNVEWKEKFEKVIEFATSRYGIPYVVANDKLVIDDNGEWIRKNRRNDHIKDAFVSKNGVVAVGVQEYGNLAGNFYRILVGDTVGEKYTWENKLKELTKVIVDDETDRVAAFGKTEKGKDCLIIEDIPYELKNNVEKLEYFAFKDGDVVIQYKDALGKLIVETIKLKEDAKELELARQKQIEFDNVISNIRKLLAEKNLSPEEMINIIKNSDKANNTQAQLTTENEGLKNRVSELETANGNLDLERQNNIAMQQENEGLKNRVSELEKVLQQIENITDESKKGLLGSVIVDIKSIKKIIEEQHPKK